MPGVPAEAQCLAIKTMEDVYWKRLVSADHWVVPVVFSQGRAEAPDKKEAALRYLLDWPLWSL